MQTPTEEKRIHVSENAMRDERVDEILVAFDRRLRALQRSATRSWFSRKRATRYCEAAEELCRLSRRIVWSFVNSVICCPAQVEAATKEFDLAASQIQAQLAAYPDVVEEYQQAIRNRSIQLKVALDDFNDLGTDRAINLA